MSLNKLYFACFLYKLNTYLNLIQQVYNQLAQFYLIMSKEPLVVNVTFDYPEEDPNYQGDELDQRLKQGPLEDRGCTDAFWCILYLVSWGGLIFISVYAFANNNPAIFNPYQGTNAQCGIDNSEYNLSDYPYLYVDFGTTVSNTSSYTYYCVQSCPNNLSQPISCPQNGSCPLPQYDSHDYMQICEPDSSFTTFWDQFGSLLQFTASEADMQDISKTWPISLFVCILALLFSIMAMYLIKWFAACLVWSGLVLYISLLITAGFLLFFGGRGDFSNSRFANTSSGWMEALAYTAWSIAAVSLLLLACYFKRIHLAVAVIKAAADFTRDVCEAVLVPIAMFAVMVGFFIYWVFTVSSLLTCGTSSYNSNNVFPSVTLNSGVLGMISGASFSFYWNCQFAMAFCQYVIASCCCMWYFHHMGATLHNPVTKSVTRGLLHHSGSLALGSLILTIVFFIRTCFDVVHKIFKDSVSKNKAAEGCCAKCWFGYCGYIIKCFEKFIRFLTQNAYIMVALTGRSFCKSAHDAFYLISRNKATVAITDGIGEIFTTIGVLFISALSTFIGFIMITQIEHFSDEISSPVLPTIFFAFLSLTISSLFMNVYGMGVDTILLCYMADVELFKHEGGAKSIPPALKEFLDNYYYKK